MPSSARAFFSTPRNFAAILSRTLPVESFADIRASAVMTLLKQSAPQLEAPRGTLLNHAAPDAGASI